MVEVMNWGGGAQPDDVACKCYCTCGCLYELNDKSFRDIWFNNIWSYKTSLSGYTIKSLSFGQSLTYCRAINYYSVPLSLGYSLYLYFWFDYRIGPLSISAKYNHYLFWAEKYGDWLYNQKTYELNLSFTLSRFMNLRAIGQYNSSTKNLLNYCSWIIVIDDF